MKQTETLQLHIDIDRDNLKLSEFALEFLCNVFEARSLGTHSLASPLLAPRRWIIVRNGRMVVAGTRKTGTSSSRLIPVQ
jgi:hypothetical protein